MSTTGRRYQGRPPRTAGASAYFLMLSAIVNLRLPVGSQQNPKICTRKERVSLPTVELCHPSDCQTAYSSQSRHTGSARRLHTPCRGTPEGPLSISSAPAHQSSYGVQKIVAVVAAPGSSILKLAPIEIDGSRDIDPEGNVSPRQAGQRRTPRHHFGRRGHHCLRSDPSAGAQ